MSYVGIHLVHYDKFPSSDYGFIYVAIDKLEMSHRVSYAEGLRELEKLSKQLGREPQHEINQFDPTISYITLHGCVN